MEDVKMKNPNREIMLQATAQGLMALWLVDGQPDADVVRLFGTHILPTGWTGAESMDEAVREIRRLNPGVRVSAV